MKLTSKGRYAVMAMADLAKNRVKEPTSLAEISLRQGISLSFLEQLFLRLKKNNLVQSARGPHGGYVLSKAPEEIKLLSIIQAVDEKIKTVKCKKSSKNAIIFIKCALCAHIIHISTKYLAPINLSVL